jgi:2-keto-4-pentenoate hydratase/2-oxohepta-3-ene-1,7-dioic acid hydratase in catechol pathway
MNFCRYNDGRYGLVKNGDVYDISDLVADRSPRPAQRGDAFVRALPAIVAELTQHPPSAPSCSVEDAVFLSPVLNPTKLVAAPVNYEAHLAEARSNVELNFSKAVERIEKAGLFLKASSSLVGPGEGVATRFPERRCDHEIELAVVIGTTCSYVSEADALDYVAGYAIGLDMSIRGPEDRSFRKSPDTFSVLGPWMVTADAFGDPSNVSFTLRVNGELRQQSDTSKLVFSVPKLISWASEWYTLHPGDVIYTGTPDGVGPVTDGDVMDCIMDGIGTMAVKVRSFQTAALV